MAERFGELLSPALRVRIQDLRILQHFYESTGGAQWANGQGWKVYSPAGDPCGRPELHFRGVGCHDFCDDDIEGPNCRLGRITRLELPRNSLSGTLPRSLADLVKISMFDLSHNRLSGTIPTEIGLLSKLSYFRLDANRISGTLPTQLGRLGSASVAGFTYAGILAPLLETPTLPFTDLRLGNNRLSGMIPSELGGLTNLEVLHLSGNPRLGTPTPNWQIVGHHTASVPWYDPEVFDPEVDRAALEKMYRDAFLAQAAGAGGSGSGEASSGEAASGAYGGRRLSGAGGDGDGASGSGELGSGGDESVPSPSPPSPNQAPMVDVVRPAWQLFPGSLGAPGLPTELGRLTRLVDLQVAEMPGLSGTLPTQLGELASSLASLHVPNSRISGHLPTQLGRMRVLEALRLDGNRLSGSLVPELGGISPNIRRIDLEANPLSGTIPEMLFFDYRQLEYRSTFGCNLTGHLPMTVQRLGTRMLHFEFYVQDENLDYLADHLCQRDEYIYQRDVPPASDGTPYRDNRALHLIQNWDRFTQEYCHQRPLLDAGHYSDYPGERLPSGFLPYGHTVQWTGEGADPKLAAIAAQEVIRPNTSVRINGDIAVEGKPNPHLVAYPPPD